MKNRQALSPMISVVILIAVTSIIGVAISAGGLDMVKTQMASDSFSITTSKLSTTSTTTWVSLSVKNDGNSQLSGIGVTVTGLKGDDVTQSFKPDTISPSRSASVTFDLGERIPEGTEIISIISGNSTTGGIISQTIVMRP